MCVKGLPTCLCYRLVAKNRWRAHGPNPLPLGGICNRNLLREFGLGRPRVGETGRFYWEHKWGPISLCRGRQPRPRPRASARCCPAPTRPPKASWAGWQGRGRPIGGGICWAYSAPVITVLDPEPPQALESPQPPMGAGSGYDHRWDDALDRHGRTSPTAKLCTQWLRNQPTPPPPPSAFHSARSLTAKKKRRERKLFRYADAVKKLRLLTAVGG